MRVCEAYRAVRLAVLKRFASCTGVPPWAPLLARNSVSQPRGARTGYFFSPAAWLLEAPEHE